MEEQVFTGKQWCFESDGFLPYEIRPGTEFEHVSASMRAKPFECTKITPQRVYAGSTYFDKDPDDILKPGTRRIMKELRAYEKAQDYLCNLARAKDVFGSWENFIKFRDLVSTEVGYRDIGFRLKTLKDIGEHYDELPECAQRLYNCKAKNLSEYWEPIHDVLKDCKGESYCSCDSPYHQRTEDAFRSVCDMLMAPYRKMKAEGRV